MSVFATVPTANGTYTIELGDLLGQIDVSLVTASAPGTGTLRVQAITWSGSTVQLGGASAIAMSSLARGGAGARG